METSNTQSILNQRLESVAHPDVEVSNISVHGNQSSREVRVQASSHSNTSTSFSFNSPSQTSLIDRTILLRVPVVLRVTGAAAINDFRSEVQKFGPSAYPLSRCMRTLTLTVNNQSITVEPHSVFPALSKLFNDEEQRKMNSYTPTMPDRYNTIELLRDATDTPLNSEPFNNSFNEDCRGAFPFEVNDLGNNEYDLHYEFTEPLPHSFLTRFSSQALTRISNMSVQITWTNLNSMFTVGRLQDSAAQNPAAAQIGPVNFVQNQAELLVRTFNPSVSIPPEVSVPFHSVNVKRFAMGATAGGDLVQAESGQIIYNQTPDKIVIFARRRDEVDAVDIPDAFLSLQHLQLRTEQNIELAGASQRQLYQMSRKNGYNMGWRQWSLRSGSVAVIDVSEDIGGYVPGSMSRFSFNVSATYKDTRYTDFNNATGAAQQQNEFYIVGLFSAKLTTNGTSAFIQQGMLESEVLASLNEGFRTRSEMREAFIDGAHGAGFGSFWKKVKKPLHAVAGLASNVSALPAPARAGLSVLSDLTGSGVKLTG